MLFTEGTDRHFERMMTGKPGWDNGYERRQEETIARRDCTHCLHYINKTDICKHDICPYYED